MPKLDKIFWLSSTVVAVLLLAVVFALPSYQPESQTDQPNQLLGNSALTSGQFFKKLGNSVGLTNISNDFFIGGSTSGSAPFSINKIGDDIALLASGSLTFRGLKSCDTIDTDVSGVLSCGTDGGGGGGVSSNSLNFDEFQNPLVADTDITFTGGPYAFTFDHVSVSGDFEVTGAIKGNASTATALAANGANCNAGEYPLGVNASGAVESCTAIGSASGADTDIPFITFGNTASLAFERAMAVDTNNFTLTDGGANSTLTVGLATGLTIPLTASVSAWEGFYDTPSSRITAGTGFTWSTNTFGAATGFSMPITASLTAWEAFRDAPSTRITDGTGLTWSGNTLNVVDSYLLNTSDTFTGNLDIQGNASVSGNFEITGTSHFNDFSLFNSNMGFGTTVNLGGFTGYGINLLANAGQGATGFAVAEAPPTGDGFNFYWVGSGVDPEGRGYGALDTFSYATDWYLNGRNVLLQSESAGNVGIGTTVPGAKLEVNGDFAGNTAPLFNVASGSNSRFYVQESGNVGIGTTGPGAKLEVATTSGGSVQTLTILRAFRSFVAQQDGLQIAGTGGTLGTHDYGSIVMRSDPATGDGGAAIFDLHVGGASSAGGASTKFLSAQGGAAGGSVGSVSLLTNSLTRIFIQSDGNVGIGTTGPGAVLNVDLSDAGLGEKTIFNLANNQTLTIQNNGVGGSARFQTSQAIVLTPYAGAVYFNDKNNATDAYIAASASFNSYLNALGGNVGIGTTGPTTKLDVSGNASVSLTFEAGNIIDNGTLGVTGLASFVNASTSGNFESTGFVSGATYIGAGVTGAGDCNDATDKLLYDSGTGLFSCGTLADADIPDNLTLGTITGTIDAGGATSFEVPNSTTCTVDAEGELCSDPSGPGQFLMYASASVQVLSGEYQTTVSLASTSFNTFASRSLGYQYRGITIKRIWCKVSSATSVVINLSSNGTTDADQLTCTTSNVFDDGAIANATINKGAELYLERRTVTDAPDFLTLTWIYVKVRE